MNFVSGKEVNSSIIVAGVAKVAKIGLVITSRWAAANKWAAVVKDYRLAIVVVIINCRWEAVVVKQVKTYFAKVKLTEFAITAWLREWKVLSDLK